MAETTNSTDPTDPYQDENASFDGGAVKPEQTEEQIAKAFDITEYLRDVID
ncbi:metal-sulfur cluster assembly factor, partial [Streptococcus pseudopneumoniae]|nr:metal-sulfur cluster assembly factor [Streptococcus pseudopneumoniae]